MKPGQIASVYDLAKGGFKDDGIIAFAEQALEEARVEKWAAAGEQHCDWNRRAAMYFGKDKKDDNPYVQRPRENRTWRSLENQRYVLMDHVPVPEFLPRNPERDQAAATQLSQLGRFVYDVSNYRHAYAGFVHNMIVYGTGVLKTFWAPNDFGGLGMVRFAAQDPRTLFVAPGSRTLDEAPYVIAGGMEDIDGVIARYPEHEAQIRSAKMIMTEQQRKGSKWSRAFQMFGGRYVTQGATADESPDRQVEVLELYTRIPSVPGLDLQAKGKVDHRYRVIVVVAGQVVVANDWLPFEHGRLPFVSCQSRFYHDRVWGISDLEIVESLQQELNRMADKRNAWIELTYFPWIINPAGSGVPDEQMIHSPGTILHPSRPDHGMGFMTPPETGRHIQSRRFEIMTEIDEEIGTYVISAEHLRRNIQPTTIAQYREAGEAPVRMKIRFMEAPFQNVWMQAIDLMRQYYEPEIMVRIQDEQGREVTAMIDMNLVRQAVPRIDETEFEVRVGLTGNAAISRAARRQEIVEAVQAGAFNEQLALEARIALLDSVEFPGRAEVIAKWRAAEAARLAAEQAQQQAAQMQATRQSLQSTDPGEVAAGLQALPPDQFGQLAASMGGTQPPPAE